MWRSNIAECRQLCQFVSGRKLVSFRSSHRRCSIRKGVLKKIRNMYRKKPMLAYYVRLYLKKTLLKKILWHRCFPWNLGYFKNSFFTEHFRTTASLAQILEKLVMGRRYECHCTHSETHIVWSTEDIFWSITSVKGLQYPFDNY